MSQVYSVFGLTLLCNIPISGLASATSSAKDPANDSSCVEVHLGISPVAAGLIPSDPGQISYASTDTNASGQPLVRIRRISGGDFLCVEFDDGADFWLARDARRVWAVWRPPLLLEDAISYLLGPILGLILRLRGVACLHASAVSFGGRAVAFAGPEGAGKSTTAAMLAQKGYPALSDDIVALVERDSVFFVLPAYPHICLWPDSVEALFGSADAVPRFSLNWEKHRLALGRPELPFETKPALLSAICLLGQGSESAAAPLAEPVSPRDAFLSLVANSYATNALDPEARANEVAILGRLVAAVPMWRLRTRLEMSLLVELCRSLSSGALPAFLRAGAATSHP